jgi:hypothetical protein
MLYGQLRSFGGGGDGSRLIFFGAGIAWFGNGMSELWWDSLPIRWAEALEGMRIVGRLTCNYYLLSFPRFEERKLSL